MKLTNLSAASTMWAVAAAASLLLGSSSTMVLADDCNVGEEQLEFTFFLDEDSITENGWSLSCEGEGTLWNVPIGSLQVASGTPFVKEQTCLPEDFTCHFTLEDSRGDGLLFPGYYYLTFGATTIAVSEQGEEFLEKSYCFGPNCPIPAKEVEEQCDSVHLFFRADNSPEESSIKIECNNDPTPLFSKSDFTTPFEVVDFEYCLPVDQCCTLTISDSASNGLSAATTRTSNFPASGHHVFVEWANQVIFTYDESNPYRFGTVGLNFGLACPNVDPNPPEVPARPQVEEEGTDKSLVNGDEEIPNDLSEDINGFEMAENESDGMSSTIKIGLFLFAGLAMVGLAMLVIARYCYPTSSAAAAAAAETSSATVVMSAKDLEDQSVSSKGTDCEDEELA
jgi:hypothetical protein